MTFFSWLKSHLLPHISTSHLRSRRPRSSKPRYVDLRLESLEERVLLSAAWLPPDPTSSAGTTTYADLYAATPTAATATSPAADNTGTDGTPNADAAASSTPDLPFSSYTAYAQYMAAMPATATATATAADTLAQPSDSSADNAGDDPNLASPIDPASGALAAQAIGPSAGDTSTTPADDSAAPLDPQTLLANGSWWTSSLSASPNNDPAPTDSTADATSPQPGLILPTDVSSDDTTPPDDSSTDDDWGPDSSSTDTSDAPDTSAGPAVDNSDYTPPDITTAPDLPADLTADTTDATDTTADDTSAATSDDSTTSATATPAIQIDSSHYVQHYTYSGGSKDGSFSLDVTLDAAIAPATGDQAAAGASWVLTGTTTATASLHTDYGWNFDVENEVTPFSTPIDPSIAMQGMPLGGYVPTYGFGYMTWDHTSWNGSITFEASGSYTADNGGRYQFVNHSSRTDWSNQSSTWTDAASSNADSTPDDGTSEESESDGSGTAVSTSRQGSTYNSELIQSDNAANFPTDDNSPAPDPSAAPADGTHYLQLSSASGFLNSNSTITNTYGSFGILTQQAINAHNDYHDQVASRYYFQNSTSASDPTSGDRDQFRWDIDNQSFDEDDGNQDTNLTDAGGLSQSGTQGREDHDSGNQTNHYAVTDAYHRGGDAASDGTSRYQSDSSGSYSDDQTLDQTYADGSATQDQQTYRSQLSSDAKMSQSDSGGSTIAVGADSSSGAPAGQTVGTYSSQANSSSHSDGVVSGASDQVAKVNSIDDSGSYQSKSAASGFNKADFTAADGSLQGSAIVFASNTASTSGTSKAKGNVNSDGQLTDGSSYDQAQSNQSGGGFVWSKQAGTNQPTQTSLSTASSSSSGNATADLTYDDAGTANGTLTASGSDASDTDVVNTVKGSVPLSDGTGQVNDTNHNHSHSGDSLGLDLTLCGDQASGTITMGTDNSAAADYGINRKIDRDNDVLHAQINAGGSGKVSSTDTVTITLSDGNAEATRTTGFTQQSSGNSSMAANGKLDDGQGRTGDWRYKAQASSSVDDTLTVNQKSTDSGWSETGRQFSIDHSDSNSSEFHEKDQSYHPAADAEDDEGDEYDNGNPAVESSWRHKLDMSNSTSETTVEKGTPDNYTFSFNRKGDQQKTEWSRQKVFNLDTADGFTIRNYADGFQSYHKNIAGTSVGGQRQLSLRDIDERAGSENWTSRVFVSPASTNTNNSWQIGVYRSWAKGDSSSGDGGRKTYLWSASWGATTDRKSGAVSPWGDAKPSPSIDTEEDLSWPGASGTTTWDQLKADFLRDAGVQWLLANGGSVLQIGVGIADVIGGAVMTLGNGGGVVVPLGVGLMSVGVDQIIAGVANWGSSQPNPSLYQYLGYSAASGLGASESTAQTIGDFTPAVLAMAFAGLGNWFGRGPQSPAAPNVPGLARGPGTATSPPPSLGARGAIVGSQAIVAPGLGAGPWPALVVNGRVFVARFHDLAWQASGRGFVQAYGAVVIDSTGKVIRWGF